MAEDHIKIDDITPRIAYTVGATAQSAFAVPFPFFEDSDLRVTVGGEGLTLGADYTASGAGSSSGGAITLATSVSNTSVVIWRRVPIERVTDFPSSGPFRINSLNAELSRHVAIMQQIDNDLARALQLPDADPRASLTLPSAAERAGRLVGFDDAGDLRLTTTEFALDAAVEVATAAAAAAAEDATEAASSEMAAALSATSATEAAAVAGDLLEAVAPAATIAVQAAEAAVQAAGGLAGFLKGPPTSTAAAYGLPGRDLGDLAEEAPFFDERLSAARIDLARGTGVTIDFGSIA